MLLNTVSTIDIENETDNPGRNDKLICSALEGRNNDPSSVIEFDFNNYEKPLSPEKYLMLAILEDALFCFSSGVRKKKSKSKLKEFKREKNWFFSDSKEFYSFRNICQELNFSPDYILRGLMQIKKRIKLHRHGTTVMSKVVYSPTSAHNKLLPSEKGKFSKKHKFVCNI